MAEDVALWEAGKNKELGLYLVLGVGPNRQELQTEEDGHVYFQKKLWCATYEGVVRAAGGDKRVVEIEGADAVRRAGHHGFGMLITRDGKYEMVDAKGQGGSLIQMVNSAFNTGRGSIAARCAYSCVRDK